MAHVQVTQLWWHEVPPRKRYASEEVAMKTTVKFRYEKSTKGAVKYMEVDDKGLPLNYTNGGKILTMYLRKDFLGGRQPQDISVELTIPEAS